MTGAALLGLLSPFILFGIGWGVVHLYFNVYLPRRNRRRSAKRWDIHVR